MDHSDCAYYRRRAADEWRKAGAATHPSARQIHLRLAVLYGARATDPDFVPALTASRWGTQPDYWAALNLAGVTDNRIDDQSLTLALSPPGARAGNPLSE